MIHTAENEKDAPPVEISTSNECYLVTFSKPFDKENPKDWSKLRKWTVTGVLSATGFNRIMVSTIMAPALTIIGRDLHMNSVEAVMALSVYLLATAFGPLLIGPLSEVYGRKPVLHVTNIWFLIWNLVCGFTNSKGILIAARLLAGLGASAIYALAGGVLGDVWRPEQRGRSLSLYILFPLLAAAIGPMVGGFIIQGTSWRWIFWLTSIIQAIMIAISLPIFHETHAPTILAKRAKSLRQRTGNLQYHTREENFESGCSASWILRKSLSRPIRLLLFHPIVQVQACMSGFSYGTTYLVISTFSTLWTTKYHESVSTSGLHYFAMCIGEIAGAELGGPLMDYAYSRMKRSSPEGLATPEFRVPIMLPGVLITPLGLLLYGWAAHQHMHWIVVDLGAAILSFGMQIASQAMQAYVIDAYLDHASSATAASQFLRSLAAFGFPLFAPKMYSRLGYGWGNTVLAIASVVLVGIPAPWILWVYGARLREKARSSY